MYVIVSVDMIADRPGVNYNYNCNYRLITLTVV